MWLMEELERQEQKELSLNEFVREAWQVLEPAEEYVDGWAIHAICEHLEAVTAGQLRRVIFNVPPGCMKSLLVNVFWPAWEWGEKKLAHHRFVNTSHSMDFSARDSRKMRLLVESEWYKLKYRHVVIARDQREKINFHNTLTGFRRAAAFTSLTGHRGHRVVIDDPLSVDDALSIIKLKAKEITFLESVPSRLVNAKTSAIILIMQRLAELDTTGVALSKELGYEHVMLPMRFERDRRCRTSIGFVDPRNEDGELLFPERFPEESVAELEKSLGSYGAAGQLQQRPAPRGGGIIKEAWIRRFTPEYNAEYVVINPAFHYVIQSWDTAFKTKEENDFSCCTTWGVNNTGAYLIHVWKKKVPFPELTETVKSLAAEYRPSKVLIEDKASGQSLIQALQTDTRLPICPVKTDTDKVSRLHAVSGFFESGRVFVIDGANWESDYIYSLCSFPAAAHDDDVDSTTQALAEIFLAGQTKRINNFSIMGR